MAVQACADTRSNASEFEGMNKRLIQSEPSIMMGKPVVAGTRITVELILEKLAAGETIEQLLDAHPRLTSQGVLAALESADIPAREE